MSANLPRTLTTVSTEGGKRLERYVRARWDRDEGGMRGLTAAAGISSDALYRWFRGDAEPTLEALGQVARVLGVRRSVLVAVYDGDQPDTTPLLTALGPEMRAALVDLIAAEVERKLRE